MLRALDIHAATVAEPLRQATLFIAEEPKDGMRPVSFLRRGSKWHRHRNAQEAHDRRLWEVAVLFQIRETFRQAMSGWPIQGTTAI